jgi:hypothetical protein
MNYGRHPLIPFARELILVKKDHQDMPGVQLLTAQIENVGATALQNLIAARDRF